MKNILILSCGTRRLLVDYFADRKNGFDRTFVTDCSPMSPALFGGGRAFSRSQNERSLISSNSL